MISALRMKSVVTALRAGTDAVLEHREWLEAQGSLHARRAEQQREWMWAMVDAALRDDVRRDEAVRAVLAEVEPGVRDGSVSAVDAAARVLEAFRPGSTLG